MNLKKQYDVIVIGGSYAGLAAGMALGRALKQVLIIDGGKPCNAQTPQSHNFLTQDGKAPSEIAAIAKRQVEAYPNVTFLNALATKGHKTRDGFEIEVASGERFAAAKLIFATGIQDQLPDIPGFSECWGISVLHCPYCHGYEVKGVATGILANGNEGYEFAKLIANWSSELTIFTNGASMFTSEQLASLRRNHIKIEEKVLESIAHRNGYTDRILFTDGSESMVKALYAPRPFKQHSNIPESLGCALTEDGYLKVDAFQETTVSGVFAAGDNASRMRTVANAVSTGTTAGMTASKKLILEQF